MDLETVQKYIDEIEYNNDIREEAEEELLTLHDETVVFASLYNEFSRKRTENQIKLQELSKELDELMAKEQRLGGRSSKKMTERKEFLNKEISNISAKVKEDLEQKLEAQKSYKEITSKNQNVEISKKLKKIDSEIELYTSKLNDIYNEILINTKKINEEIKEVKEKLANCIVNNKDDEYESLTIELAGLIKERNENHNKYYSIIKLIDDSKIKIDNKIGMTFNELNDSKWEYKNNLGQQNETSEIEEQQNENLNNNPYLTKERKEYNDKMLDIIEKAKEKNKDEYIPKQREEDVISIDESRIDKDHQWMTSSNAFNTNYVITEDSELENTHVEDEEVQEEPKISEENSEELQVEVPVEETITEEVVETEEPVEVVQIEANEEVVENGDEIESPIVEEENKNEHKEETREEYNQRMLEIIEKAKALDLERQQNHEQSEEEVVEVEELSDVSEEETTSENKDDNMVQIDKETFENITRPNLIDISKSLFRKISKISKLGKEVSLNISNKLKQIKINPGTVKELDSNELVSGRGK